MDVYSECKDQTMEQIKLYKQNELIKRNEHPINKLNTI